VFLRCCVVDGYCSECVHLAVQRRSKARVWRIAGLHTVVRAPSALFHLPLPMFYTCSLRGGSFCSSPSGPPCPICLLSDVLATQPASSTLTPRLLQLRIRRLAKRPWFISLSSVDVKLVAAMDQARAVERVRTRGQYRLQCERRLIASSSPSTTSQARTSSSAPGILAIKYSDVPDGDRALLRPASTICSPP
jgi:hypothetical protein